MTERPPDLPRRLLEIADELAQRPRWHEAAQVCRAAAQSLTDSEAQLAKEREAHRYTAQALVEACAARDAKDEAIATLRAAGSRALAEMVNTVAPRDSFTDAVDALDAALLGQHDAARETLKAAQAIAANVREQMRNPENYLRPESGVVRFCIAPAHLNALLIWAEANIESDAARESGKTENEPDVDPSWMPRVL